MSVRTPETVEEFVRATAHATIPKWVADELAMLAHDFTGRIEINFFQGGIANLNIVRSVKPH